MKGILWGRSLTQDGLDQQHSICSLTPIYSQYVTVRFPHWRYTYPEIASAQPERGFQQCWSTKYVIFGDKFTTVQQVLDVQVLVKCYRSLGEQHLTQACRVSFFCTALASSRDPMHFGPGVFTPWGMTLGRGRHDTSAEIIAGLIFRPFI